MLQDRTYYIGGTLVTLGALGSSVFPTLITPPSSCVGGQLKIVTLGSGATVQIMPITPSGVAIAGATAVGASITGYPIGTAEIYEWTGPAAFYLANTAAASTVAIAFRYSGSGITLA